MLMDFLDSFNDGIQYGKIPYNACEHTLHKVNMEVSMMHVIQKGKQTYILILCHRSLTHMTLIYYVLHTSICQRRHG